MAGRGQKLDSLHRQGPAWTFSGHEVLLHIGKVPESRLGVLADAQHRDWGFSGNPYTARSKTDGVYPGKIGHTDEPLLTMESYPLAGNQWPPCESSAVTLHFHRILTNASTNIVVHLLSADVLLSTYRPVAVSTPPKGAESHFGTSSPTTQGGTTDLFALARSSERLP
jgi:hypothetical protein